MNFETVGEQEHDKYVDQEEDQNHPFSISYRHQVTTKEFDQISSF